MRSVLADLALEWEAATLLGMRLAAACDHPTTIEFPAGEYLKGLVLLKTATSSAQAAPGEAA